MIRSIYPLGRHGQCTTTQMTTKNVSNVVKRRLLKKAYQFLFHIDQRIRCLENGNEGISPEQKLNLVTFYEKININLTFSGLH